MQTEIIPCPFCSKGRIETLHMLGVYTEKHNGRNALGSGITVHKSAEIWNIQTGCTNCGKKPNEIKRAIKEGVPPDQEKLKKRYNEIMKLKEEMKNDKNSP